MGAVETDIALARALENPTNRTYDEYDTNYRAAPIAGDRVDAGDESGTKLCGSATPKGFSRIPGNCPEMTGIFPEEFQS